MIRVRLLSYFFEKPHSELKACGLTPRVAVQKISSNIFIACDFQLISRISICRLCKLFQRVRKRDALYMKFKTLCRSRCLAINDRKGSLSLASATSDNGARACFKFIYRGIPLSYILERPILSQTGIC